MLLLQVLREFSHHTKVPEVALEILTFQALLAANEYIGLQISLDKHRSQCGEDKAGLRQKRHHNLYSDRGQMEWRHERNRVPFLFDRLLLLRSLD